MCECSILAKDYNKSLIIRQHWFDSQVTVLEMVQLPGTIVIEQMQKENNNCAAFRGEIIVYHTFVLMKISRIPCIL